MQRFDRLAGLDFEAEHTALQRRFEQLVRDATRASPEELERIMAEAQELTRQMEQLLELTRPRDGHRS